MTRISGRVFTVFSMECRFGLPLLKPFTFRVNGELAAFVLQRETSPLEFVDPTNSLEANFDQNLPRPFKTKKPLCLPDTKDVKFQVLSAIAEGEDLQSPDVLRNALESGSFLAVFSPQEDAVSLRSIISTEIVIAFEISEEDWKCLPDGKLDERFIDAWDEFIRTYHMVTSDVRPPFWRDSQRLVIVKQAWSPYTESARKLDAASRLISPSGQVSVARLQIRSSYSKEGKFFFDQAEADQIMRKHFSESKPVSLGRETLSGARRAVELFGSGKTAVIESAIATEVAVSKVVAEEKLKRGVSKNKLDEYRKEVGVGYQLNVDLPMFLAPLTDEERGVIGAADAVRKRRNEVIHQGAQPTREEGERAVAAVQALLNLLHARGHFV